MRRVGVSGVGHPVQQRPGLVHALPRRQVFGEHDHPHPASSAGSCPDLPSRSLSAWAQRSARAASFPARETSIARTAKAIRQATSGCASRVPALISCSASSVRPLSRATIARAIRSPDACGSRVHPCCSAIDRARSARARACGTRPVNAAGSAQSLRAVSSDKPRPQRWQVVSPVASASAANRRSPSHSNPVPGLVIAIARYLSNAGTSRRDSPSRTFSTAPSAG